MTRGCYGPVLPAGRGAYGRARTYVGDEQPLAWYGLSQSLEELNRIGNAVAKLSGEITRKANAKGYATHDPMLATEAQSIQDALGRAGKPDPQDRVVQLFTKEWVPFVVEWSTFYKNNYGWWNQGMRYRVPAEALQLERRLATLRASLEQIERPRATAPAPKPTSHKPTAPTAPTPTSPTSPTQSPAPQTSPEPELSIIDRVKHASGWEVVKIGVIGALALGGIVALSSVFAQGRR